jgi:protein-disulfide isomerase
MATAGWRTLVLLLVGYSTATAQTDARADVPLLQRADSARIFGTETAEVIIDEYIDFACSDCRNFYMQKNDSLKALLEEQDAIFILRVYPIPGLMRGYQAAEAAFCAAALGEAAGFLGMVNQLFTFQNAWKPTLDPTPYFEAYAENLGLPLAPFSECLRRDAMSPLIVNDIRMGTSVQVPGTPTFVFNNKSTEYTGDEKFSGVEAMENFLESIDRVRQRGQN